MLLAAGKGERMRPLTEHTPKPLLTAGGKPLIVHHIERLTAAGVVELVINIAYLGEKIQHALGDGEGYGVSIVYSKEPEPLETAGAILNAATLLGDDPFLLVNADVWTDYPIEKLLHVAVANHASTTGHLVMVPNPPHNVNGDFAIADGRLTLKEQARFTFSGLSVLAPSLVLDYPKKRRAFPLGEVFRYAIANNALSAEVYQGHWWDIGTPERLQILDQWLKDKY